MDTSGLSESLKKSLGWHKSRVTCFLRLLLGLLAVKTVNLKEIALAFGGTAQVDSRYRRLQRFFASLTFDYPKMARWLLTLYHHRGEEIYLVMDRTNWFVGKQKINIFMLGFVHEGMAIPL